MPTVQTQKAHQDLLSPAKGPGRHYETIIALLQPEIPDKTVAVNLKIEM